MQANRGKAVSLGVLAFSIATLVAATLAFKRPIVEEWHVFRLESKNDAERMAAARALVDMHSVKAIPHFINLLGKDHGDLDSLHWCAEALVESGPLGVASLLETLISEIKRPARRRDLRFCSRLASVLGKIGVPPSSALQEALGQCTGEAVMIRLSLDVAVLNRTSPFTVVPVPFKRPWDNAQARPWRASIVTQSESSPAAASAVCIVAKVFDGLVRAVRGGQ